MIGHHVHFRENDDLPLWRGPAAKKKPPFFNARALIMRKIMRSRDETMLSRCVSKYNLIIFVVFLPYIAPSRPPTNLTLLPLGKDGLELRWKVS